jgi:anti-sigma factor RsiW
MKTFETPKPITVVLELHVADVQITASDRVDTVVTVEPTNAASRADSAAAEQTTVAYHDGRLHVTAPKGWRQWLPWTGSESIDVRIDLPNGSHVTGSAGVATLHCEGHIGECRYKTGVGHVRIEDADSVRFAAGAGDLEVSHVSGHVDVKTAGAVRIGDIDGTAVIKNSNGDTSIREVSGELRVIGANGNIAVERARAAVVAKSANGDVRLDGTERGTIVAETARGQVDVGIRDGVAAWLDLNTAYGTVRTDLDAGEPPGPGEDAVDVRARTAYGDINIRRAG